MGVKHSKTRHDDELNSSTKSLKDQLVQRSSKSIHDKYRVADAQILASGTSTHICHATSKAYYKKTEQSFNGTVDGKNNSFGKSSLGDVAIKVYDGTSARPPNLAQEAALLQQCDHPNIVKLYEVIKGKSSGTPPSLVLELCSGGTVLDRMPYSSEERVARVIRQVTSAVAYLHAMAVVHRDVNGRNVLYESPDSHIVKLIDFGSAAKLETVTIPGQKAVSFKMLTETTGTLESMAPEVLAPDERYGPACDVWSIGVLAYRLLYHGKSPFGGSTPDEVKNQIRSGTVDFSNWKHSDLAKKFVQSCLERDQRKRWSAATALASNWIKYKGSGSTSGSPGGGNGGASANGSAKGGTSPPSGGANAILADGNEASSASALKSSAMSKSSPKTLPTEVVMSLELYRKANPIKRIALNALARKQPASTKLREVFQRLDVNNSSTLTKEEFLHGLRNSGDSEEGLEDLFRVMDVNGNGEILYTEFLAATLEADGELSDEQLREAFDHMDVDNSGSISKSDLKALLGKSEHAKSLIAECLEYLDSGSSSSSSSSGGSSSSSKSQSSSSSTSSSLPSHPGSSSTRKKVSNKLKRKSKKAAMDFNEFEQLFDHGFDAGLIQREMPSITETSLNADQMEHLRLSDKVSTMPSFEEEQDC